MSQLAQERRSGKTDRSNPEEKAKRSRSRREVPAERRAIDGGGKEGANSAKRGPE